MPNLIILRLYPVEPTSGAAFQSYLSGLTITAFDISFVNSDKPNKTQIGEAVYKAPAAGDAFNPTSDIIQHFIIESPPPPPPATPRIDFYPAATAIIEVKPPAGHKEFQTSDLILAIKRGANGLPDERLHYNVPTWNRTKPPRRNYPAQPATDVGLYLALPDPERGVDPNDPRVELPKDGSPPKYADLLAAVQKVLAADPTAGSFDILNLNTDQCRHIANEIVWNRKEEALPIPPRILDELYTANPGGGLNEALLEADRKKFEGQLISYYARHSANAEQLGRYVFSLSAALFCQKQSEDAERVDFRFIVRPNAPGSDTKGKVKEAEVILK